MPQISANLVPASLVQEKPKLDYHVSTNSWSLEGTDSLVVFHVIPDEDSLESEGPNFHPFELFYVYHVAPETLFQVWNSHASNTHLFLALLQSSRETTIHGLNLELDRHDLFNFWCEAMRTASFILNWKHKRSLCSPSGPLMKSSFGRIPIEIIADGEYERHHYYDASIGKIGNMQLVQTILGARGDDTL